MSSESRHTNIIREKQVPTSLWQRRLIISLTLLSWLAFFAVFLWVIGQVSRAFSLLAIGATIATVLYPLAKWLERMLPKPIVIGAIYLIIFILVSALFYFLANVIIGQIVSLIQYIQSFSSLQSQPVLATLHRFGISQQQIHTFEQQFIRQLQGFVNNVIPFISNLFNVILNVILVALLSIYLLSTGPRTAHWLRQETPERIRGIANFLLDTLGRTIGHNFRGVLILAFVISTITGIGLFFIGVPYPLLLSAFAFILEFIPFLGFYITAITIVLFALTQGWITALITLGFVLVLQTLEGEILAPRIVGGAVGINPIIAIFAIVAGSQLYGILGAFLAVPIAGTIQAILVALWSQWKESHPDQIHQEDQIGQTTRERQEPSAEKRER